MNQKESSQVKLSAYLYSIISTTLVLFMLGVLGTVLLHAKALSDHFRENVEITIALKDQISSQDSTALLGYIQSQTYTNELRYVSKEEAAKVFRQDSGEDFREVLDFNPLFASLNLYVKADYANTDSLQYIQSTLENKAGVVHVFYHEGLIDVINRNIRKISIILLVLGAIFLIMAFVLIDNTIKMAMYAKRFLIKSMQLVGATRQFIAKPFEQQSVYNGMISGLGAALLLIVCLLLAQQSLPELSTLYRATPFVVLCFCLVGIGVLISWLSTRQAVYKYLQRNLDDLY